MPEARRQPASTPDTQLITSKSSLAGLPGRLYRALTIIFIFSLGNASDAFLLLRMGDLGVAAFWIPLLWSAIHVVKSVSSVVGGALSDRFGRRTLIALGWLVYALVYAAFGAFENSLSLIAAFLIYGFYFGLTEGVEKAWVADLAPADERGTAFGIYNAVARLRRAARERAVRRDLDARLAARRRSTPALRSRLSRPCCYTSLSSARAARAVRMQRILVTNDDGVRSEGIHALADALRRLGEVTIVAPHIEASAIGHALTLRRPLRMEQLDERRLRGRRHADRLRQHRDHAALRRPAGSRSSPASTRATTSATM